MAAEALRSRAGAAVAAIGGAAGIAVAAATGDWNLPLHVALILFILAFSLLRLVWGLSALLVLFLFEVLFRGHGLASPARTCGIALALLAAPAVLWRLRADGWGMARPALPTLLLATFLALALASAVMAVDLTAWGEAVLRLLLLAALWAVVYGCVRSWRDLRTVLWAVCGAMCGIALLGLFQYAYRATLPGVEVWQYFSAIRATGTTIRPHSFAFMLVTGAGYGVALAVSSPRWRARLVAMAATALIASALMTTMVRSSITLGLAVVLVGAAYNMRLGGRWRTAVMAVCLLLAIGVGPVVLPSAVRTRFADLRTLSETSVQKRVRSNLTGLAIALHHPLGVGAGNAEHQYDLFRAGDDPGTMGSSHNMYLELAGTVGWPGLLSFLLFVWGVHAGASRAETRLRQAGGGREWLLLAGLRAILYAFLAQGFFWHQILTDKLIWATLGMLSAGTAVAIGPREARVGGASGRSRGSRSQRPGRSTPGQLGCGPC